MEFYGIRLVGVNAENAQKLLLTLAIIATVLILRYGLGALAHLLLRGRGNLRVRFWTRQGISIFTAAVLVLGILSVWFDEPARLTTALGFVTAGLAFALQKVITAFAGYFVILRGRTFTVGDRITMGGVRGDVLALGFIQTTIMEMGQPPAVQAADPAMWVKSRQYTGRIVTVTNDKIFAEPIYNYTRDFPYIWEEMSLPVAYRDDRARAEHILLEAARKHALPLGELSEEAVREMRRRYAAEITDLEPRVYWRITDNWLELSVRFLVEDRGMRDVKDAMSRDVLAALDAAGIGIASATYEIVGLPPLRMESGAATAQKETP